METEEVQHQLQKNLEATLQEIVDLDAHIDMLKVKIWQSNCFAFVTEGQTI